MSVPRRTVELLGGFRNVPGSDSLVVALGRSCEVLASDPSLDAPDARLALSSDAHRLDAAIRSRDHDGIPVAAVFARDEENDELASRVDVVVRIGSDPEATGEDATNVVRFPHPAIDVSAHPPVGRLVRARWRHRLGLPDELAVVIGFPHATPLRSESIPTALAVCATAAVRGPDVLLALALGTPVVTDEKTARSLGAVADRDVVVTTPASARDVARALADDERAMARLGVAGRRLVERLHDTGHAARELAARLRLSGTGDEPVVHLDDRLAELGTPAGSPVVVRSHERAEPFVSLAPTSAP